MRIKYLYIGCFFKKKEVERALRSLQRNPLEKEIKVLHVTFSYKPEDVDRSLFGTPVSVRVVGYGNDGSNEGLRCELHSDCEPIQRMADEIEVPHITLSLGKDGKAVNTCYLSFTATKPIELTGTFGGFSYSGRVDTRKRVKTEG